MERRPLIASSVIKLWNPAVSIVHSTNLYLYLIIPNPTHTWTTKSPPEIQAVANPDPDTSKHKLKRLIQSPNSYFMDVKCSACGNITILFSHSQTVVKCQSCDSIMCQPTGGKARLSGLRHCDDPGISCDSSNHQSNPTFVPTEGVAYRIKTWYRKEGLIVPTPILNFLLIGLDSRSTSSTWSMSRFLPMRHREYE